MRHADDLRDCLLDGQVIPALPLALDEKRQFSPRHERALVRYYVEAGCGGLAVGVHSTQFEIRDPKHNLFEPVLRLASETLDEEVGKTGRIFIKIAGACGETRQARTEAEFARSVGFDAVLLSLAALRDCSEDELLEHCRSVSEELPIIGFYLQPAVGGRHLSYDFWRAFADIERVLAIKIAPFNRFQSLDVVRAVADSGRRDVALYTGNDDNIVVDLLTPFPFPSGADDKSIRIVGGLLGHWGVWTRAAVLLFEAIKAARTQEMLPADWLKTAAAVTDMNAAVFDAANGFAGCIPGILEVLRRHRIVPTNLCLSSQEKLSPGQMEELDRVTKAYPTLIDDDFVTQNVDRWLA